MLPTSCVSVISASSQLDSQLSYTWYVFITYSAWNKIFNFQFGLRQSSRMWEPRWKQLFSHNYARKCYRESYGRIHGDSYIWSALNRLFYTIIIVITNDKLLWTLITTAMSLHSTSAANPIAFLIWFFKLQASRLPSVLDQKKKKGSVEWIIYWSNRIYCWEFEAANTTISTDWEQFSRYSRFLYAMYVEKMLKEIKNENIKLNSMTTMLQTVMTAKTADIGTKM